MIHTLWHYDSVDCLIALKARKSGEGRRKKREEGEERASFRSQIRRAVWLWDIVKAD